MIAKAERVTKRQVGDYTGNYYYVIDPMEQLKIQVVLDEVECVISRKQFAEMQAAYLEKQAAKAANEAEKSKRIAAEMAAEAFIKTESR
jgi:hypothetical protein